MTSESKDIEEDDPWLTVADFADQLRVKPVTVRSWISKGRVKATRSGERKWLIRTSEVARMLNQDGEAFLASMPRTQAEFEARTHTMLDAQEARYEWTIAVELSRHAPPDARFASRIRQIAQASSGQAKAIRNEIASGRHVRIPLDELDGELISYELRPGVYRPGPQDAWDRFDRLIVRLRKAMNGESQRAAAKAFEDLAAAMNEIADALTVGGSRSRGEP
jgi:excisionase family DNA binding protein